MEHVLVVPDDKVKELISPFGFIAASASTIPALLEHAEFIARAKAEGNPFYRQLIPYVAVLKKGEVFTMRRLKKQAEQRLHDMLSCGVGGHINPCDSDGADIVIKAAVREINEELTVSFRPQELEFCGYILDSSNAVSRDHLGCFYILHTSADVQVKETEKMHGCFMHPRILRSNISNLEGWTQLILTELERRSLILPPRA